MLSCAVELAGLAAQAYLRASRWYSVRILLWTGPGRRRRPNASAYDGGVSSLLDNKDPLLLDLLLLGERLAGVLCKVPRRIGGSRRRTPKDPRTRIGRGKQGACSKDDRGTSQ